MLVLADEVIERWTVECYYSGSMRLRHLLCPTLGDDYRSRSSSNARDAIEHLDANVRGDFDPLRTGARARTACSSLDGDLLLNRRPSPRRKSRDRGLLAMIWPVYDKEAEAG